jgi:succinate dehydrogenase/fumarate reductase-like Fe-S protein
LFFNNLLKCSPYLTGNNFEEIAMSTPTITAKVFRFDPLVDRDPYFQEYRTPLISGMSAMDVLDYIYQNLDGTLAYYDHAGCALGACAQCRGKINGKPGLLCQTLVDGDVTIEPIAREKVVKDLVTLSRVSKNGA